MNSVLEAIAPYGLITEDLPKLGLWRHKKDDCSCTVVGVILAKDHVKEIPTYRVGRKRYKDEQILVLASCVTTFEPELSMEDYIPSIATFTLEEFEKNYKEDIDDQYKEDIDDQYKEDIDDQFACGGLASALASMYI